LWLHQQLIKWWGILIDSNHIIGHYRIDSVNRPNCPGPLFPWDRLFADLKGDVTLPEEWQLEIMQEAEELGLIEKDRHKPDEPADKWFVLALALKLAKKLDDIRTVNQDMKSIAGITSKYVAK